MIRILFDSVQDDMSRDVVVQLTRLALSPEKSIELEADIYMDYSILLTVVRVAQCLPRPIKLEVAIKVRFVCGFNLIQYWR